MMPQRHTKKANAVDMIHEKGCRLHDMFETIKNNLHAIATLQSQLYTTPTTGGFASLPNFARAC